MVAPSLTGSLLSPASALGPPRGLGDGSALLRRPDGEEFRHVHEQAKANREDAVCRKGPFESGARQDDRRSPDAGRFEADAGSGPAAPAGRGHHRRHHGFHRLAAALGARVLCRGGLHLRNPLVEVNAIRRANSGSEKEW
jgi:hypothetical protein